MNSGGSIRFCGLSLPTNWYLTLSTKYRALKLAPSRGRVISKVMKAAGSMSRVARRGWLAYGAQFTYEGTSLRRDILRVIQEEA